MDEPRIRAVFDAAGLPLAFFGLDLFPDGEDGVRHPSVPADAVEIGEDAWRDFIAHPGARRWDGATCVPYSPPARPAGLADYAEAARYGKETGGITVAAVPIATSDRSKILIAGARQRAVDDPDLVEAWSALDGTTHILSAPAVLAISRAVGAHVSACFKVYAEVRARLDASPPTITTTAEIDAAFAAMPTAY